MRLTITQTELDLLLRNVETSALAAALITFDGVPAICGTAEQFDDLRELVSDVLLRIGFDENYKPTSEGLALEGLIDKLFIP